MKAYFPLNSDLLTTLSTACVALVIFPYLTTGQQTILAVTSTPDHITIDERQDQEVHLAVVDCVDFDPMSGNVTTTLTSPVTVAHIGTVPHTPCGDCFNVFVCPAAPQKWCLIFTPNEPLDHRQSPVYTLTISCLTDSTNTSVETDLEVSIVRVFHQPVIHNLVTVSILQENEPREVLLASINCTDPNNEPVVVSINSVSPVWQPCAECFSVLPNGPLWDLKYLPGIPGTLEFADGSNYVIDITCIDLDGNETSVDFEVRIVKNSPPVFQITSLTDFLTVNDTLLISAATELYKATAKDQNNDTLYYTMTSQPDTLFEIGYTDGIVRASGILSQVCESSVTWSIRVEDNVNPPQGPLEVIVSLHGANVAPEILNMNQKIQVAESSIPGNDVYPVRVTDDASLQDLNYVLTADPPSGLEFFQISIDSTGSPSVIVKAALDYKCIGWSECTIKLTLTVGDAGGCYSAAKYLCVEVTDINEPPQFGQSNYVISTSEGYIDLDHVWTVTDPDCDETFTFQLVSSTPAGVFTVDPDVDTGRIKSLIDYDVDQNRMPSTATLTVRVSDRGGLTSDTVVTLIVTDVNDNHPVITNIVPSFHVTECTQPGTKIGLLACTDLDSSLDDNNVVRFLPVNSGHLAVLSSGWVILRSQMPAGTVATISTGAEDRGHFIKLRSVNQAFISVTSTVCPVTLPQTTVTTTLPTTTSTTTPTTTTTSTTTAAPVHTSHWTDDNLAWMTIAVLLMTLFLALLTYFWIRFCSGPKNKTTTPRRRIVTPITQVQPAPAVTRKPEAPNVVGPQDRQLHDFWKEMYTEEDFTTHPDRKTKPAPVATIGTVKAGRM